MDSSHYYCLREPAHEIRLLDLLPATASGDLNGRVRRFSIGSAPAFVSASHVWGDKKADRAMSLESGCGVKNLQISLNLESFLVNMLCHTPETLPEIWEGNERLPMWIDMICIDQLDNNEKALQIPLMRDIYSKARSVVIWIHNMTVICAMHSGICVNSVHITQTTRSRFILWDGMQFDACLVASGFTDDG